MESMLFEKVSRPSKNNQLFLARIFLKLGAGVEFSLFYFCDSMNTFTQH